MALQVSYDLARMQIHTGGTVISLSPLIEFSQPQQGLDLDVSDASTHRGLALIDDIHSFLVVRQRLSIRLFLSQKVTKNSTQPSNSDSTLVGQRSILFFHFAQLEAKKGFDCRCGVQGKVERCGFNITDARDVAHLFLEAAVEPVSVVAVSYQPNLGA